MAEQKRVAESDVVTEDMVSLVMRELGRRGGSVKGVSKGFAAQSPKKASKAASEAARRRWDQWRAEHPEAAAASEERRAKRKAAKKSK